MGAVTYRCARERDTAALAHYMRQILTESDYLTHDRHDPPLSEAQLRTTIAQATQGANQLVLLALSGDNLIGLLRFRGGNTRRTRHTGEVGITVRRRWWGRGVATGLLTRFLKWVLESGAVRQVNLRVRPDNQRALALYRRHGFAVTGRMNRELCIDGRFYDHLVMGLSIEPPSPQYHATTGAPLTMSTPSPYRQIGPFTYLTAADVLDGQRPTLLFLHGSGHSALFWEHQLDAMANAAACLAMDLPGHGRNQAPVCTSVAEHAAAVGDFLDALGVGPVIPVGLSLGGAIVQWLLLHHPDRCRAGVIVNSGARLRVAPAIFEAIEGDYLRYLDTLKEMALGAAQRGNSEIGTLLERCTTMDAAVTVADFRCCDQFDVMADLGRIQHPVLVMAAAEDQLTPPKYGAFLEEAIPGARRVTLGGVGHLSPVEAPLAFNTALTGFVEALPSLDGENSGSKGD
jgi:pimeloyl-ACP methyl ester carboxylesterase/ribosomal protein S18 acetylase RimI-like enzyme